MSTGDYHHTALAVARGVGMVPPQGQVIIIQTELETRSSAPSSRSPAAKASEKPPHRLARHLSRSVSFAEHLVVSREREHQGLIFHVDNGNAAHDDALQALAAIAQVCKYNQPVALSQPSRKHETSCCDAQLPGSHLHTHLLCTE